MQHTGSFHRSLGTACAPCKRRKIRCQKPNDVEVCLRCQKKGLNCSTIETQIDTVEVNRPRKRARTSGEGQSGPLSPLHDGDMLAPHVAPVARTFPKDDILKMFFEHGIHSLDWAVFSEKEPVRLVYTGNQLASLHQLVRSEDPSHALHYPFPQIKPAMQWKPDMNHAPSTTYMTPAVSTDLSTLPAPAMRDSLLDTYFTDIHPGLPIINETEFRKQYKDTENPPPLLLLQCVLLAAARISVHPAVEKSRPALTATLYRRAKTLFEMRHENDRIILVQAAILLSWHVEDSDTVSNGPYHWIGQATRIAFGLGVHRNLLPSSPSLMPPADRIIYRRVWWTLVRLEASVAMEYGRPSMIRVDDFDQVPLLDSDFIDEDLFTRQPAHIFFCQLDSKISELTLRMTGTITATGPRAWDESIDHELAELALQLPSSHTFWSCQLRISHSMVTLLLHRTKSSADSALVAQEAASAILSSFETMLTQNTIRRCTYFASTALLAAAVQFAQTIKHQAAEIHNMRALSSHAQLERLLKPIEALSTYWPHIQAVHKLVTTLHNRCARLISKDDRKKEQVDVDFDLDQVLSDYPFAEFWRDIDSDWMNTFAT